MKQVLVIIFSLFSMIGLGQTPDEILSTLGERNFYDVQHEMNTYYSSHPDASGFKQWKRIEHDLEPRVYPSGEIINYAANSTREYLTLKRSMPEAEGRSTNGVWSFYGPNTITGGSMGRINCVDFDPNNTSIIYIGSASGGVWKSTNSGTSWIAISPHIPSLSIADIEIDPNNSNVIYLLTGDGFNVSHPSLGMLKSTDGGNTWHTTGLSFDRTQLYFPEKLLMHPTNANIQYIATNKGLLKTTDGWQTEFDPITDVDFSTSKIFDIEFEPGDPSVLYLSMLNALPVRKSINSGATWIALNDPTLTSILGNTNKIEIALSPNNPTGIYAHGGNGISKGLLRSLDAGTTWSIRDTAIGNLGLQSGYNMSLVVDPANFSNVFLGQVWTKRSSTGGSPGSWVGPSNYVHADVHESKFHNGAIYHCNDGGLFRSTDNGVNFTELSQGISITEVYQIGGTPLTTGLFYAGLQDNGSIQRSAGGSYKMVTGNDGGHCLINYLNSNIAYTSSQFGFVYKTTNGGMSFTTLTIPQQGTGDFLTPMVMDPVDPETIFIGLQNVYRNENGLDAGSFYDLGNPPGSGAITEMAQSEDNRSILYVSSGNKLYRTTEAYTNSGFANWVQINNELPDLWITGIALDPNHNGKIYVSLAGYNEDVKVYFSDQWGNPGSWQDLTGNLPNVQVSCIKYHQNPSDQDALYIGTEIGVFYRDNIIGDWLYYSNYLPSVQVNDLFINDGTNQIVAGTYGRGLWVSDLYEVCTPSLNLNGSDGGNLTFAASQTIMSSVVYVKDESTNIKYRAGNHIDLKIGFDHGGGAYLNADIGPCPIIYSDLVDETPQLYADNFSVLPENEHLWIKKQED